VISLCRLWQQQNRRTEARALLAEIYGSFTEGLDTSDFKEAKALFNRRKIVYHSFGNTHNENNSYAFDASRNDVVRPENIGLESRS